MYDVFICTRSLLLIISKMISPHQTLSSCWLNLHVPCNSEKPVPYLHLQAFLLAVHLSPQERPWHMSLSAFLSPGIVWVRKLVRRWLFPPELRLPGFEWWWAHSWPEGGAWSSCALGLDGENSGSCGKWDVTTCINFLAGMLWGLR